jgi:PAS domain S-box-containing protein/putative nucleotidyltransferase with HDIG domain
MLVEDKTKEELITELLELQKRIAELEKVNAEHAQARDALETTPKELDIRARELNDALNRANEQLRMANRALLAMSECHALLSQATDECELLQRVCQIAVETARYRLAWVGYAQEDEAQAVQPVAQAGYEEGYLETLNVTWADTERGQGPTGTAIRTGEPTICRNTLTDPKFEPWWAEAIKRGYASSIALPLTTHDQTWGALNIYAAEPDSFDTEEVRLLTELANSLAYGVIALRTRADRDLAIQALQESESKFRDLAEKSFVAIYLVQDGIMKYSNPRLAEIFGLLPEEPIGKEIKDFIHPEDWPIVEENIRKRISEEVQSVHYVFRGLRASGEVVWVEVYGSRTMYQGRPAIIGAMLDITGRELMEEALHLSEEKYRTIIEQSNDMIWTSDAEGQLVFFNKHCLEMCGYCETDWSQASYTFMVLEDYVPWVTEAHRRALLGEPQNYEMGIRKKDGNVLYLSVNTAPIFMNHQVIGTVSFGRDITLEKRTEQALREERDELQRILDVTNVIIVALDSDQTVSLINKAGCEILGYTQNEIIGRNWFDNFVPERDRQRVKEAFAKLISGETEPVEYFENAVLTKGGEERLIAWHNTNLSDESGNIIGTLSSGQDITQCRKLEEESNLKAQLLDAAGDSIILYDLEGNPVYANEAACRLRGYSREELTGMNLHSLDTPEQAELIESRMRELVEKGEATFESANFRKDGSIMPIQVHARSIESGGRKLILAVSHDITERKQAASEIENTLRKLRRALGGTIQVIALTVETKDPFTAGHQRRVANLARAIAKEMGLSSDQIEGIRMAGVIHDIGKISVPAEILSKPGHITDIELALIKDHPQVGHDILKTIEFPWPIAEIILQHHERMDGSGYPSGISGDEIILEARVLAVADVVEAMASHRPYRPALSIDQALREISENRGTLYDPNVVDACLRLFAQQRFTFE